MSLSPSFPLTPNGRMGRRAYWTLTAGVTALLAAIWAAGLPLLAGLLLPTLLIATVRRLHDTGRNGRSLAILLVPLAGFAMLLWWLARPGARGANAHGVDPCGHRRVAAPRPAGAWPRFH